MQTADFVSERSTAARTRAPGARGWLVELAVIALITATSTFAMLQCASPELWFDEADYSNNVLHGWRFLWS